MFGDVDLKYFVTNRQIFFGGIFLFRTPPLYRLILPGVSFTLLKSGTLTGAPIVLVLILKLFKIQFFFNWYFFYINNKKEFLISNKIF